MPNFLFALLTLLLFALSPQQQPTAPAAPVAPPPIPPAAVHLANPIKPTPSSQAHAKNVYQIDCAMCHGAKGDGKGDASIISDMNLTMTDFNNPATLKNRTDGELFYIIKNGEGKMPAEDRVKTDEIWNLVVYVRSFSKK